MTYDPHMDYVRSGRLWHPRPAKWCGIDVLDIIWHDLWSSLGDAIAMGRPSW